MSEVSLEELGSAFETWKIGADHAALHFGPRASLLGLQNIEWTYSFGAPKRTPQARS
jgi:hypothetical protein